jgi:hypothetical protein
VELLVVIGTLTVLLGLLLPALARSWEQARTVQFLSQLRQLGSGLYWSAPQKLVQLL